MDYPLLSASVNSFVKGQADNLTIVSNSLQREYGIFPSLSVEK